MSFGCARDKKQRRHGNVKANAVMRRRSGTARQKKRGASPPPPPRQKRRWRSNSSKTRRKKQSGAVDSLSSSLAAATAKDGRPGADRTKKSSPNPQPPLGTTDTELQLFCRSEVDRPPREPPPPSPPAAAATAPGKRRGRQRGCSRSKRPGRKRFAMLLRGQGTSTKAAVQQLALLVPAAVAAAGGTVAVAVALQLRPPLCRAKEAVLAPSEIAAARGQEASLLAPQRRAAGGLLMSRARRRAQQS